MLNIPSNHITYNIYTQCPLHIIMKRHCPWNGMDKYMFSPSEMKHPSAASIIYIVRMVYHGIPVRIYPIRNF